MTKFRLVRRTLGGLALVTAATLMIVFGVFGFKDQLDKSSLARMQANTALGDTTARMRLCFCRPGGRKRTFSCARMRNT